MSTVTVASRLSAFIWPLLRGILHAYMPCWTTLPHSRSPGAPKRACFAQKGPFWDLGHPLGPKLVPTATGWSNWVGCIHIMCLGPLRELYGTHGAPERAHFSSKGPHLWPWMSSDSPGEPNLVPNGVPTSPMTPIHKHSAGQDVI